MKMRQLLVFLHPEEAGLASSRVTGVVRDKTDERTVPMEVGGCMLAGGREGKMEILVQRGTPI